jgi:hypothetical protein
LKHERVPTLGLFGGTLFVPEFNLEKHDQGLFPPETCPASEHKRQLETQAAYKPMRATETLQRLGAIAEILET